MSFIQKFSVTVLLLFSLTGLSAQPIVSGTVSGETKDGVPVPLEGASVYWADTSFHTLTDAGGRFALAWPGDSINYLVVSFIGYQSDTLVLYGDRLPAALPIVLSETLTLGELTINSGQPATEYSAIKPINTEKIGIKELRKAACCNLSESFESNASVDVMYTDAMSGTKAIQMLGLSGIYTQLLTENVPLVRGLSASSGLSYIPGTWIESIYVTKGVGSVLNGYESMTGQINVEFLKPEDPRADKVFLNFYGNSLGRGEANVHLNHKFNDKVSTLLFTHGSGIFAKNDINRDGFLDNPLSQQLNVFNRWKIQGENSEQVIGVRGIYEDKTGGQLHFNPAFDRTTTNAYGIGIRTRLIEGFVKNGYLFPNSVTRSLGIIASGKYHAVNSYYGLRTYDAEQQNAYVNLIFQDVINTSLHNYKVGLSFLYDRFRENYIGMPMERTELVPGAFAEYHFNYLDKFSLLAGLRGDYHNLYGFKLTPRMHLRYNPSPSTVFRLSGGTGFRTPNVLMENSAALVSSRTVYRLEALRPEETLNVGGGITRYFSWLGREASLNLDYYYTYFKDQVVVDMDYDPNMLLFYNLSGRSFSHSAQADLDVELRRGLTAKLAYKHYLVKSTYSGVLLEKPMLPRHRVMLNLSYHTRNDKWKFDLISNWFSASRLPSTESVPEHYRFPERSEDFYILHFQVTKVFRHFEWYVGGENLLGFRQRNPIMGADDPFGPHFDASMIWGPLNGQVVYTGLRLSLN